jgi:hypothetical protein
MEGYTFPIMSLRLFQSTQFLEGLFFHFTSNLDFPYTETA